MSGVRVRKLSTREAQSAGLNGTTAVPPAVSPAALLHLRLDQVVPSADNPRKRFDDASDQELADSIRSIGILQPLVVRELNPGAGLYELIAGERRWRAAKLAGLTEVPATLFERGGASEAAIARIVENVQRQDLSANELADALHALVEAGLTQAEAGKRLGLKGGQPTVSRLLKVRELPADVRALLAADDSLAAAHAQALAGWAEFPAFVTALAKVAIDRRWGAKQIAAPDLDGLRWRQPFNELMVAVDDDVFARANCQQCPWNAHREFADPDDQGEDPPYMLHWCFHPEHAEEIGNILAAERRTGKLPSASPDRSAAIAAAVAAAHAPAPMKPTTDGIEVGDRVAFQRDSGHLGEGSVLEKKPSALLIHSDDGKEFWTGTKQLAEGQIQVLGADGHATSHISEPAVAPRIPSINDLPYDQYERIGLRSPAVCRAGQCPCFGKARGYADNIESICTDKKRHQSLVAQASKARNAENRRRHVEAVSQLEDHVRGVADVGVREMVVLTAALADQSGGYRPPEARFGAAIADSAGWLAGGKSSIDLIKADLAGGRLPNIRKALDTLDGQETVVSLTLTLVEAICRQDLAMRFLPDGGPSYGSLAAWYVGSKVPARAGEDWQPEPQKAKAKA